MSPAVIKDLFAQWPYVAWALLAAAIVYAVTKFAISHLHPDRRAHISLWLQGDYESTWTEQYRTMFDRLFGEKHFSIRCFALSSIASILAVIGLWILFDQILGVLSIRATSGLNLWQAFALGIVLNIIPDFLSLAETRWLLKQFEKVRNPLLQLAMLLLDAAVTATIIYIGIRIYLLFTGQTPITIVEMVALFSFYAVFFYSTFLTSVWAWIYCLSSWIARASIRWKLSGWFDVHNAPGAALGMISAILVFFVALVAKPVFSAEQGELSTFDEALCNRFTAAACSHVARLAVDEERQLQHLAQACLGGVTTECLDTAFAIHELRPEQAVRLWRKSCDAGDALGCSILGVMYQNGRGVDQDDAQAAALYRQACDAGEALSCNNLGIMYLNGRGVEQDYTQTAALFRQACDAGQAAGCNNLGGMYQSGVGVKQDDEQAAALFRQACDAGAALACSNLGIMYEEGRVVEQDDEQATALYKQACDAGSEFGCRLLDRMDITNNDDQE